ncbi:MAG: protein-L-isoaspartate(D-aspartate) O-methyltransferase [bacterium]
MSIRKHSGTTDDAYRSQRLRMVDEQLTARGIRDSVVLAAMRTVPRHLFVPRKSRSQAYHDGPLTIGYGQTISQPYVVASMTEHLELQANSKVLEIGTGCGYQAAVLAEITHRVFTIEMIPELLQRTDKRLHQLGYGHIRTMLNDGSLGWAGEAPFDAIIVTAAAPRIPEELIEQLAEGGRMVLPLSVNEYGRQDLVKLRRMAEGVVKQVLYEVRFVPMRGEVEQ